MFSTTNTRAIMLLYLPFLVVGFYSSLLSEWFMTGDSSLIWKTTLDAACVAAPTIDATGELAIIGCNNRKAYAIFVGNGTIAWYRELSGRIQASAAISGSGAVFIGTFQGDVYSLDPFNGDINWKLSLKGMVIGTPLLSPDDQRLYVGVGSKVFMISAADGTIAAVTEIDGTIESSLAIDFEHNLCYVASTALTLYAIELHESTMTVKWKYQIGDHIDFQSSPVLSSNGSTVYIGGYDRRLHAINVANGETKWIFQAKDIVATPFVSNDGRLFVGSSDRMLYSLQDDGKLLWGYDVSAPIQCKPLYSERTGIVITGSSGKKIVAVDEQGHFLWQFNTKGWVISSPTPGPNCSVLITSLDKSVYRIGSCKYRPWAEEL